MLPLPRENAAVRVAKALGDPTRFRLLEAIAAREETSCHDLTALVRLAQATVSHHLKVLSDAGLVSARNEGPYHYYRVLRDAVAVHCATLTEVFGEPRRRAGRAR
jgi:ArsR family transcriptional regulator